MNYQTKMEEILCSLPKEKPSLLLHSCCGPCSTYVLETLSKYFNITIYYYNPNIYPEEEFLKRFDEQKKLITEMKLPVSVLEGTYENDVFEKTIDAYRDLKEGSFRCFACYQLRLEKTVIKAKELGFDYFTTTLSISPYKNSQKLNEIGQMLANQYGVSYLYADFKKKNGYKRSVELSAVYHLYRQDYCGCVYSQREARDREKAKNAQL